MDPGGFLRVFPTKKRRPKGCLNFAANYFFQPRGSTSPDLRLPFDVLVIPNMNIYIYACYIYIIVNI